VAISAAIIQITKSSSSFNLREVNMESKENTKRIIVAGDIFADCIEVIGPPLESDASESEVDYRWKTYNTVRNLVKPGGALRIAKFISNALNLSGCPLYPQDIDLHNNPSIVRLHMTLGRYPYSESAKDEKNLVYRVTAFKGYSGPQDSTPFYPNAQYGQDAEIIVLSDSGNGFNKATDSWPKALDEAKEPFIVVKMDQLESENPLWEKLCKQHPDRLAVVVEADMLRKEGVNISRRLSWERTAKDFIWQMSYNVKLQKLKNCKYIVVRFGVEGVILYFNENGNIEARLFFDPSLEEDSFGDIHPGSMLGLGSAFVAALVSEIALSGFEVEAIKKGIRFGLLNARHLWQYGFGKELTEIDFPYQNIFQKVVGEDSVIAEAAVPVSEFKQNSDPNYWCIINDKEKSSLEDMAYSCVKNGVDKTLSSVPYGRFSKFRTFDRSEIEGFRGIRNLMKEYLSSSRSTQPLSIAVFGAPGSGKSFGVTQVAQSIASVAIEKIEFNLSQFNSALDLVRAFHRVRDIALAGKVPIVFFDEFDSDFDGALGWLKYFLAPMQDGLFRDGDTVHPIGKSIFVFAGGTCSSYMEFCRDYGCAKAKESEITNSPDKDFYKKVKLPDFISRLRGYVNIKGPNPLDDKDKLFIIRRALALRVILEENARQIITSSGKVQIDFGVLRAFIKVTGYKHGIRSMMAIIKMSMLSGRSSFEQAALPLMEQLELHVDADEFYRLVLSDVIYRGAREPIAIETHNRYRHDQEGKKPFNDPAMAPWEQLSEELKESNRLVADRIPKELEAVNCGFFLDVKEKQELMAFKPEEIECMAKIEHACWLDDKINAGWKHGLIKDDKAKIHPHLIEWTDLPEDIKEIDRELVKSIPEKLASLGYVIYRMK
jgi:hypothetical protein